MSKPTINRLEVMALQRMLDVSTWILISEKQKENKVQYETRMNYMKRYKELTGEDYVYQDVRRQVGE